MKYLAITPSSLKRKKGYTLNGVLDDAHLFRLSRRIISDYFRGISPHSTLMVTSDGYLCKTLSSAYAVMDHHVIYIIDENAELLWEKIPLQLSDELPF